MKKAALALFFILTFLIFWETGIVNRTEADDAFEYAYQVETHGHDWLYHPHHLLFGAVTKDLFTLAGALGYQGRAYPMLRLISALCGAGAVLVFFKFCYRRFSMRPVSSILCSGLLLFSYGFWRYSNEAEVIVPSCFIMLLALYLSVNPDQTTKQSALAGILCGVSVLFHILNAVPVFLAVPLFYLLYRNVRGLVVHVSVSLATVTGFYAWVYLTENDQLFHAAAGMPRLGISSLVKGAVGFSQCLASANFSLGYETVRTFLAGLFPYRMLGEEFYMGESLPLWQAVAGSITFAALLAAFLFSVWFGLVHLFRPDGRRKRERVAAVYGWKAVLVVAVWFVAYAGAILFLEPGNPEVWVMGLVPFWLLFCGLIAAPISRDNRLWVILALVAALALHNTVGGMAPLRREQGDYNGRKADWVLRNAGAGDLILTAGNPVFERYLRYYSTARVEYLHHWSEERLSRSPARALDLPEGRVFVLGDVFAPPASLRVRFPNKSEQIDDFARRLKPRVQKVHDNEFAGVYTLRFGSDGGAKQP